MGTDTLSLECQRFARYLVGNTPSEYVIAKYHQAHRWSVDLQREPDPFDAFLLDLVRRWPAALGPVDAYTSFFRKQSILRKKLIALLSILETSAPSYSYFDLPDSAGKLRLGGMLIWQGLNSVGGLLLGATLLAPLYGAYRGAAVLRQALGSPPASQHRPATLEPLTEVPVDYAPAEPALAGGHRTGRDQ